MDNLESLIIRYWTLSSEGRLFSFQFDDAFKLFRGRIKEKLSLHGMLTLEDYLNGVGKYYDVDTLKQFSYHSFHTGYEDPYEEILERLFNPRYKHFREIYINDPIYNRILTVYNDLENTPFKIEEQILLMERAINCAHRDGLFIDIEKLRETYDKNLIRLSTDSSFGILNRSGIELKMGMNKNPFNAIFIDFSDIKTLNEKHGYEEVNKKICKKLGKLKNENHIIGRWFSGDEIIIISLFDFDNSFIELLNKLSTRGQPKFKYWYLPKQQNLDELRKNISHISKTNLHSLSMGS